MPFSNILFSLKQYFTVSRYILLGTLLSTLNFVHLSHAKGLHVDNFVLIDQHGASHELYYNNDAKAVVLIVHGNGCQIIRSNLTDYEKLQNDYADQGVDIYMINSNLQDSRASIANEANEWGINLPILDDRSQIIGKSLELNRSGEVLVINPDSWEIVYRGPLSDRVDYERQKSKASNNYVRDALDTIIDGKKIAYQKINSPGCIINYDLPNGNQISYTDTIAPLLKENCMACHIQGGIAPWAMTSYNMIKGFAPMIREVIRTKRMPPWHADPEIGHWLESAAISDEEVSTLVSWIEAGAPRGDGPDPLAEIKPLQNQWELGEPDLIIDIPAFEIPATGTVDYQFPEVANPLDHDVWIIGAAIIPGDPQAVHHILAGSSEKAVGISENPEVFDVFENYILAYAPGNAGAKLPEGTGVFVPKGGSYQFQMHYTPYGKKSVDQSKIGLYFADKPPKNFYRENVIADFTINIPANTEAHTDTAYFEFSEDAVIHALFPHAHYRGKSLKFDVQYPDGTEETLLSVPNYDFNWQRTYRLTKPKTIPAGSRIVHTAIYDNSVKNRGNPDPNANVRWGLQSEEEMLYGSFGYSWANETTEKPIHNEKELRVRSRMGVFDQNMDGKVTQAEMPKKMLSQVKEQWNQMDRDKDGGLNLQEVRPLFMKSRSD